MAKTLKCDESYPKGRGERGGGEGYERKFSMHFRKFFQRKNRLNTYIFYNF
jgi:hypothetical protein